MVPSASNEALPFNIVLADGSVKEVSAPALATGNALLVLFVTVMATFDELDPQLAVEIVHLRLYIPTPAAGVKPDNGSAVLLN